MGYIYIEASDALFLTGRGMKYMLTHVDPAGGRECLFTWRGIRVFTEEEWDAKKATKEKADRHRGKAKE